MRNARKFGWLAFCLGLGCGRTALLSEQNEAAVTAGTSAQSRGGTASGGAPNVSTGGKTSFGGTFPLPGGMPSGGFGVAGSPIAGVGTMGGFPNADCRLSVGDCRLTTEPECANQHNVCTGDRVQQQDAHTDFVIVNDIAVSTSGRLALAGRFRGSLDFGGDSQPLVSAETGATGTDAFVVSIDASGAAQWSYVYSRNAADDATGLRFAPNGDLVVQGRDATGVFVQRLDVTGQVLWSKWSANTLAAPGRVGIDNDGRIVLGGSYTDALTLAGAQLTRGSGNAGYLIKLEGDGDLLWADDAIPSGWLTVAITGLAVDDEDNIVVVGNGTDDHGHQGAFIQKVSSNADAFVTTFLPEGLGLRGVAVDRNMRMITAGAFYKSFSYEGTFHELSLGSLYDVWVAQFTRAGELSWQKAFASGTSGASVEAVAVDPYGNVVVAGNGLDLSGTLPNPRPAALYTLKLRPDGHHVWTQSYDRSESTALGIDNRSYIWLAGSTKVSPPGMDVFWFQIFQ